jgi:hypothetical protein
LLCLSIAQYSKIVIPEASIGTPEIKPEEIEIVHAIGDGSSGTVYKGREFIFALGSCVSFLTAEIVQVAAVKKTSQSRYCKSKTLMMKNYKTLEGRLKYFRSFSTVSTIAGTSLTTRWIFLRLFLYSDVSDTPTSYCSWVRVLRCQESL